MQANAHGKGPLVLHLADLSAYSTAARGSVPFGLAAILASAALAALHAAALRASR